MQRSNGRSRRVGRGAAFAVALAVVAGGPGRPPAACAAPGDPASSGLHFQPGWNLFAMAVVPDAASTQALMSADGLGRFWEWTGAGYDPAATFSPHCGYWAFCQPDSPTRADGIELWMHGTEPEGVRPAFTPGWNLFGVSRPVPLAPPGALRGTAFRWDAGRQILRVVATSAEGEPGVGYWGYANRGPVANPDTASLFVTAGSLALDVLANDRDPEADPLVITAAGTPTMHGGQVEILDGGHRLRYTPPPDFFGTDHFAYTISDPDGLAAETTVEITVRPNLVERLAISPLTAAVLPGASQGYTVTAEYSDGAVVGNPAGAVLSAEPAGAVSIAGLTVTVAGGADAGPVVITAACGGRTAGAVLDVLAVLRDLTLSPADVTLSPRERQEFTVTAHYSDGTARPNPAGVQFQVSPVESFAVVGQTVTVLTSAPLGAATVSASYAEGGRLSASARITVSNPRNAGSFFPVIGRDAGGQPVSLVWSYRVNDGRPVTAVSPDGTITYKITLSEMTVTVDKATLQRITAMSGTLTGTDGVYSGQGTLHADVAERLLAQPLTTLTDWQRHRMEVNGAIAGTPYTSTADLVTDEFSAAAVWFIDRTDLDSLPVGTVYSPPGGITTRVHGTASSCGMQRGDAGTDPGRDGSRAYGCTPVDVDSTGPSAERWEIVGREPSMIVQGKSYGPVVIVRRQTRLVDTPSGRVPDGDATYYVAKGVGIIKATGAYRMFGQDFPVELQSFAGP